MFQSFGFDAPGVPFFVCLVFAFVFALVPLLIAVPPSAPVAAVAPTPSAAVAAAAGAAVSRMRPSLPAA